MALVRVLIRVTFVIQLTLGLAIWLGLRQVIAIHILDGLLFAMLVIAQAALAARAGAAQGRVLAAVALGVVVPAFGLAQEGILVGDAHWIVEVAHLGLGFAAIGAAGRLGHASVPAGSGRAPSAAAPHARSADPTRRR